MGADVRHKWVDGEIPGSSEQPYIVPATYKAVSEVVLLRPECYVEVTLPNGSTEKKTYPEVIKKILRREIVKPQEVKTRIIPNEIKDGKTKIIITPGRIEERVLSF